jgi:hypothetical protein
MPDPTGSKSAKPLNRRRFLHAGILAVLAGEAGLAGRETRGRSTVQQPIAKAAAARPFNAGIFVPELSTGLIRLPAGARSFDPYLHRVNGPFADPINLVFSGADANGVAHAVGKVLGWPVVPGSPMLFLDGGEQRTTLWQLGKSLGGGARWHLRIENMPARTTTGYVLAAVHHDSNVACGDVGGQFDQARDLVAHGFAHAGYHVSTLWLANTKPGPQCDGSMTAGDGHAVLIDLASKRKFFTF